MLFRRALLIFGGLLALGLSFGTGWVIGLMVGVRNAYHRQYLEERDLVTPHLAADPAFAAIELSERSSGGINLGGKVPTSADQDRLQGHLVRALGEPRTRVLMTGVSVGR